MGASRTPAQRGGKIEFQFEGERITAFEGETVAAALIATGVPALSVTREGDPRMPLCNMGTCFDCAVTVDGRRMIRSCLTDAVDGMVVMKNEAC